MALVDFYHLAVLYNLSRSDEGVFSNHSHLPMSTPTPPSSHSPTVRPGPPLPLPSSATQLGPKTPERKRKPPHSVPNLTPVALGTSILQRLQPGTDDHQTYDSHKYEQYIAQDFERHRVFVDIEVFMKHVLHVPDDWKTLWEDTIHQVKRSITFKTAAWDYSRQCEFTGTQEHRFYQPLVNMGNSILDFTKKLKNNILSPRTPQSYLVNDPRRIHRGVMKNLSPDIVAVHNDFLHHLDSNERETHCLKDSNLTWAHPLQVLEVKPWDGALVDGSCMPRLKVNGKSATTSRGVHPELTWNRTRPTAEPRPPSHAVAGTEERGGYPRDNI